MQDSIHHRRRSVLYVPASKARALEKSQSLDCDAVIFDLEDAVAPEEKALARDQLRQFLSRTPSGDQERIVRINPLTSEWAAADLAIAANSNCDAILLPKVDSPKDIDLAEKLLLSSGSTGTFRLWAMIETTQSVLNIAGIAGHGGALDCLVIGTNDLVLETGISVTAGRQWLQSWLMQVVLAAKAGSIDVLDGVFNDFGDLAGFQSECAEGRAMGFNGKTLIHPGQITIANRCFSPSLEEIAFAQSVVAAFNNPENAGKGVISLDGRMIELLHLTQARRLLAESDHP